MSDTEHTSLIEFPCAFPIKIMGQQHPDFHAAILSAVSEHAPDVQPEHLSARSSSKSNYTSVTLTVNAHSKEQLDKIYHALTAHPMVKVVL